MKRSKTAAAAILLLCAAVYTLHHLREAQHKAFTLHLLRRILQEVEATPECTVPEDLAARLTADGLYEWNGHLHAGEPVADLWGTPIQFIKQPPAKLTIRSAGKDRELDTNDDYSMDLVEPKRF